MELKDDKKITPEVVRENAFIPDDELAELVGLLHKVAHFDITRKDLKKEHSHSVKKEKQAQKSTYIGLIRETFLEKFSKSRELQNLLEIEEKEVKNMSDEELRYIVADKEVTRRQRIERLMPSKMKERIVSAIISSFSDPELISTSKISSIFASALVHEEQSQPQKMEESLHLEKPSKHLATGHSVDSSIKAGSKQPKVVEELLDFVSHVK
ncbi:hypothetical protein ADUPG1_003926 [Aduncisulcus paluster]|uniref:Uncharacterized protein n=1 Tax=Aduncisulcus paluster TaxID=2918883 RepID=A0ABQ5JU32_9EUKA|nr:hypothetical protein ADUPG1_003926 [Aduncisulcus paluster]